MFETLLYDYNLVNKTPKVIEFDDLESKEVEQIRLNGKDPGSYTEGFYMIKGNTKYVLDMEAKGINQLDTLPIRVLSTDKRNTKEKNVVEHIREQRSFKITPKKVFNVQEIFQKDNITHDVLDTWTTIKIITFTAYCSNINIAISGYRHTGKTSYPDALGQITNKGYVVGEVKSVLGLVRGITRDGYIVLDEFGDMKKDAKDVIKSFLFQKGAGDNYFKTGKGDSAAHKLLAKYEIDQLSCIILCNLYEDYLCVDTITGELDYKKKKNFFHYMFGNGQAINRRYMGMRMNDVRIPIKEEKRRNLKLCIHAAQFKDKPKYTPEIKMEYINIMKSMEYYRIMWSKLVDYKYIDKNMGEDSFQIQEGHYLSYRELLAGVYLFCDSIKSMSMFNHYKLIIQKWYKDYYGALKYYTKEEQEKPFVKYQKVQVQ